MNVTAVLPLPVRLAEHRDAVFASVAGVPPLVRIVRALQETGDVVVVTAGPLFDAVGEALAAEQHLSARVVAAESPGERRQCVAAGLTGLVDGDGVVLHDIEWPLVGVDTLSRIITALSDGARAVIPASLVTDSVKVIGAEGFLTANVDRSQLRIAQYPRGFDAGVLARLLQRSGSGPFDELEAVLSEGISLTVIEGDDEALSAELPRDTDYLTAVIESRQDLAGR